MAAILAIVPPSTWGASRLMARPGQPAGRLRTVTFYQSVFLIDSLSYNKFMGVINYSKGYMSD